MSDHANTLMELWDRGYGSGWMDSLTTAEVDACLSGAVALRKTCGTCALWELAGEHHLCERLGRFMDSDDGCVKGWTPRA